MSNEAIDPGPVYSGEVKVGLKSARGDEMVLFITGFGSQSGTDYGISFQLGRERFDAIGNEQLTAEISMDLTGYTRTAGGQITMDGRPASILDRVQCGRLPRTYSAPHVFCRSAIPALGTWIEYDVDSPQPTIEVRRPELGPRMPAIDPIARQQVIWTINEPLDSYPISDSDRIPVVESKAVSYALYSLTLENLRLADYVRAVQVP